ncbi:14316_t:CDS:10 [Cetraspora pellucida]|uniref:14316_t:CDS:1 n=1 Tax=Cetraspora pellucida TaxID=1433469 RepID=A0ACA9KG68_9GLOM|nr:14316_t:CDS:10 [Cetraspora pellucida]
MATTSLRRAEDRNSSLSSQNSSLQGQLSSKTTEVAEKNNQIAILNTDLTNTRGQLTETKGELTTTRKELKDLGELFNDLRIEDSKKGKELEIKGKDIRSLKEELGKSQIEIFNHKLEKKEKRLDEFTQTLGVSCRIPRELRKAYRRLIEAREDYNRNNVAAAEDDIEVIKDELLEGDRRLRIEDVQKLCSTARRVSPGATQEEIAKAYKKMALKYHPDRNRGNEASSSAKSGRPKRNFQFSNQPGSDKFKEFEEMLREVERDLDNIEKDLNEHEESLNREQERIQNEAIRNMEENLNLAGVSASDLDSSLWSPYELRLIKQNEEKLILTTVIIVAITIITIITREIHHHQGENMMGDKIQQLEAEIKYNRDYMLRTPHEDEKEKCRKIIERLEKELRGLRGQQNTPSPNYSSSSNSGSKSGSDNYSNNPNFNTNNNEDKEKNKKISQLEEEIEQLKNNKPQSSQKQQENQRKITEKEQELSELRKNDEDNDLNEQLINELINEIGRLRGENKNLKNEKGWLAEKVSRLEKIIQRLEREVEELKAEIQELKNKENRSEYENYYLSRQESRLNSSESKLEQLRSVISNSNVGRESNSNDFPTGFNPLLDHILTGNPSILDLSKHRKPNYSDGEDPLASLANAYNKQVQEIEKRRQRRVKWDKSTQTEEFEESWKRIWVADLYITRLDAESSLKAYRNGWSPEDIIDGMATLAIGERKIQIELESKKEDARAIRDKLEILLGKTKEEIIDYKIKVKEDKLEVLIQKLGINRTIDATEDKIEDIKDELLEKGVSMDSVQKLCQKCEKIAKLKAEQDKMYKERFEAKQEVPSRH